MKLFTTTEGGVVIRVGRNAKDNDALVAGAQPHHVWFHLEDRPSAHVVLCCEPGCDTRGMREDCALLTCHFSKSTGNDVVSYCNVSNLSKKGCRSAGQQHLKRPPSRLRVRCKKRDSLERVAELILDSDNLLSSSSKDKIPHSISSS